MHATNTTGSAAAAVSVRGVVKTYGHGDAAVRALDHVTLEFPTGGFTAVMGPSGSGKSTLMHCMAGLDQVDTGTILLGDTDLGSLTEKQRTLLRREKIGFVFQSFNLIPALSAAENITLPLQLAGRPVDNDRFGRLVGLLGLPDRLDHTPAQLSGGQQQRVAIGRALIARPAVVFADEPTGNLDSNAGAQVLHLLQGAARDLGQTIVMVTHDAAAASFADRVVFLADGRVVDDIVAPTVPHILDRMARLDAATTAEVA